MEIFDDRINLDRIPDGTCSGITWTPYAAIFTTGLEYKLWEIILESRTIGILVVAWCMSLWVYPRWKHRRKEQLLVELEQFATESQANVTLDEE